MSFPDKLTSTLSGVTMSQLYDWRRKDILLPEVSPSNPALYSFRDVLALRTIAFLRAKVSLQKVRTAFETLRKYDLVEHPSAYRFGSDGKTIVVRDNDGSVLDLVRKKGQTELFTLDEIFEPFKNFNGDQVVDFKRPRPGLELDNRRLGGWPTIAGTRVPYDSIAQLFADGYYKVEDVEHFYPNVSVEAARDAIDFAGAVESLKRGA